MCAKNSYVENIQSINKKVDPFLVRADISIKDAMRSMDNLGEKNLFVVDAAGVLLGSLSDGDIRRSILKDISLNEKIEKIYNKNAFYVETDYKIEEVKQLMLTRHIEWIPVVNKAKKIRDVLIWRNVFDNDVLLTKGKIEIPVVIMAGGKGSRLDPFTKILPKPLIPVKDKTILETIIDKFLQHDVKEFYLSIGHKSHMIQAYFDELNPPYKINYIVEKEPLGTAGSLNFMKDIVKDSLMVSNCDIIIEGDYYEIVDFHKSNNYDITIVGSFRHFMIPYGVCHIQNGGELIDMDEKPEFDFLVNTGMYVIKKDVLKLIPANKFFNITDLIKEVKKQKGRVGVFPIHEKSWIDVGQWKEYHQAIRSMELES